MSLEFSVGESESNSKDEQRLAFEKMLLKKNFRHCCLCGNLTPCQIRIISTSMIPTIRVQKCVSEVI